ncbi:MAG: toll/interleukin-1 receptor domain-containing protein [Verrucomicrobia bacterium]|nr:toll/interleukin-1 receptor domain-containing protein [Verrucomicrobiota bacterium]
MKKAFVSYRHTQGAWVWSRLKPCLEAGGVEVLIDGERFQAGKGVVGQMDAIQDQADVHVLVLTKDYLDSPYCRHEMDRALALDPDFTRGLVVPVRLDNHHPWPRKLTHPAPLYVELSNDADAHQWKKLLEACGASLGTGAPEWLQVRDDVVRWLQRGESVNLVTERGVKWQPLLEHVRGCAIPAPLLPDLKIVDLEKGETASRRGLLEAILRQFGHHATLPDKPEDLVKFSRALDALPFARLALLRFDCVADRQNEYGLDLFRALRHLVMTDRKLALLVQSHRPFDSLLPAGHPVSEINLKLAELKARP